MRPLRPPPRVTPPKPPLHLFEPANKQPQQAGLYDVDRYDTVNHNDYSKSEPVKLNFDDDVKEQMRILEDSLKSMLPPEKDDYPYSQNDSRKIELDDMYGAQRYDKPIPGIPLKAPSNNNDYYNKSDPRKYDYNGDYLNPQQPPRNDMFLASNKVPAHNEDLYNKSAPRKNEFNDDKYNASRFEKPAVQSSPVKNGLMLGLDKRDEKALKQQRQEEYKRQLDNQKPPAERVDPRDIKHGPSSYGHSSNSHNVHQNRSQPHISPRGDDRFSTAAHSSALVYPESSGYFGGGSGSGISGGYGAVGPSGSSHSAAVHSAVQQKSVEKGMVFGADQERDKALKRAKQEEYKRQLDQMSNNSKFKKADVNPYNEPHQVSSQHNNYRVSDSGGRGSQSNGADYSRDRPGHAQQQRPRGNSYDRHASAVVYPESTSGSGGAGSYGDRGDGAPHPAVQQKSVEKGMVFGADQERDKALKRAKQEEYKRQLDQLKKVEKEPLREPLREQPFREPAREPLQIVTSSHFQVPSQRAANPSDYHGAPSYESRDYRSGGFGGGGAAYGANVSSMRDDDIDFPVDDGFAQWQREQEERKLLVLKKQQLLQQHPGNPANNSYLDDERFSATVGAGAGVSAQQPYQLAPRGVTDSTGSRYSAAPPPQAWSEPPQQQYNNSQYSQPQHSNIHVSNSSGAINGNYNSSPTRNAPSPQRQKWDSANAAKEDAKKQAALQQRAILDQQVAEVKARKAAEKKREADEDMRRIRQLEAEKEEAAALIREEKEKKRAQEQKDLQEKQSLAAKEALKRRGGRGEAANDGVSADSGAHQNNAQHATPVKTSNTSASAASGYDDRELDYMRRPMAAESTAPPLSHLSHDELVEREMERMRREVESDYYATSGAGAQRSAQPSHLYGQPPSQLPSAQAVLTKEQFFQQQRDRERERDSGAASAYNSYDRLPSDANSRLAEHSRHPQQIELETPRDYSARGAGGAGGVGSGVSTGSPTKSPNNQARNRFNSDIYGANPLLGVGARDPTQWVPSGKGVTDKQRAGVAQQKSDLEEQIRANAERKAVEKQRLKDEDKKLLEAEKKAVSDALKATEDKKQAAVSARLQQEQQHLQLQQNNAQNKQHSDRREPERRESERRESTRDAHQDRDDRYQQSDDRRDMGQRDMGQHRGVSNVPSQSDDRYSHIDSPLRDAMNREAFRASQHNDNHRGGARQAEPVPSIDLYGPSPAVDSIDRFVSNYAGRHPAEDDRHRPQDSYKSNNNRDNVRDSRDSYNSYNNGGYNNGSSNNEQRPNGLYRLNASDARTRADSGSSSNYHGNNGGYSNIPSSTGRSHHHEDISMKSESRLVPLYPYSSSSLLSSLNPVGNSFEHSAAGGGGNQQQNRTSGGSGSGAGPPRVQPLQRHGGGGRAEDMEKSMTSHSFMQYVGQRTPLIDKYAPTSSQQQQSTTGIANNYTDSGRPPSRPLSRPQSRPQSNGRDNAYSQLQQEISQSNNIIERQQTKLVTSDGYVMKNEYDFNPYDDTEEGVPKNRILDSRYSTKNKVEDSTDYESELRTIQEHDYQQSNSNNNSINNNSNYNYGKSNSGKKKWDTSSQSVAATLQNISRKNVNVMSDDVMLN